MSDRRWWWALLAAALALIVVATLSPFGGGASDGGPWCLTCSPTWLADAIGNVVLFVPLGVALGGVARGDRRAVWVGAGVSLAVELLQWAGLPGGRTPAVADLTSNTLGTAIGVALFRHARYLLAPTRAQARRLSGAWCVIAGVVWALLAVALQPAGEVRARTDVRESSLPFTPGFGWYAAVPDDAQVNGVALPARGTGAVRVAALRSDTVRASVRVRGRDQRADVVPIVFVHDPAMTDTTPRHTKAHLLLAQRGSDAWLSSDLKAGRWGLVVPALVARDVFTTGRESVLLQAMVTAQSWQLTWRDAAEPTALHEASLTLSPMLGWAMVQTVVSVGSPFAPVMTVVWVAIWVLPIGFWLTRRQHRRAGGPNHASSDA